jgi:hypothetical protein
MSGGDRLLIAALAIVGAALGFLTPWAGVAVAVVLIIWVIAAQVNGDAAGLAIDGVRRLVRPGPGTSARSFWMWRVPLAGALAGTALRWGVWWISGGEAV